MSLERADVERAFREVSKQVHPDRLPGASPIERKLAVEHTTRVNEAHRTLRDPRRRAEYLLSLEGVDVMREEARTRDVALLAELLELQERVEGERRAEVLEQHRAELRRRSERILAGVTAYFDRHEGPRERAAEALSELRYLERIVERIDTKLEEVS